MEEEARERPIGPDDGGDVDYIFRRMDLMSDSINWCIELVLTI